jgi:osmotically inducible protein OsmC
MSLVSSGRESRVPEKRRILSMLASGSATWKGTWKEGAGQISSDSGSIRNADYSFSSRFEGASGASPEELVAAGHAGCFNQALANNFGMIGFEASSIDTRVSINFGIDEEGHPTIQGIHISVMAGAPGITQDQFEHCAERARINCTISKMLKIDPTMAATLVN